MSIQEYSTDKALIFVMFSKVLKLLELYIYTQNILNMYGNISYIDTVCKYCCLQMYYFMLLQQMPVFKYTSFDIHVLVW